MSQEETKSNDRTPNHSDVATNGSKPNGSSAGAENSVVRSLRSKGSTSSGAPGRKSVRFHDIQVREYERVVGDNPSCSSGPPIGIGWAHGSTKVLNVDNYEDSRSTRRTQRKLVLSRQNREALLAYWGVPVNDIVEAIRGNVRVKNQRRQTVTNLGKVEKLEEAFESATRKLKKALLLRRQTKLKGYPVHSRVAPTPHGLGALKPREAAHLREFHHESAGPRPQVPQIKEEKEEPEAKAPSEIVYENDDSGSSVSGFTLGNSTTPSVLEIERFYRELELEMFGDPEPPSMVGQTLEVPGVHIPDDQVYGGDSSYVGTGIPQTRMTTQDDMALLNRSPQSRTRTFGRGVSERSTDYNLEGSSSSFSRQMNHETRIPQYFHDAYEESPHPAMHGDGRPDDYFRLSRSLESLDLNHAGTARMLAGAGVMPMHYQSVSPPMPSSEQYHMSRPRPSHDSRRLRDGPEVRYIPLMTHVSPAQFMGEGLPGQFSQSMYEPVTICEDTDGEDQLLLFGAGQPYRGQQYFHPFAPEPQFQDPNIPSQSYYR